MSRKRVAETKLKSWQEVDDVLRVVGLIDLKIQATETEMNEKIIAIKNEAKEKVESLKAKKDLLELSMKEYSSEHMLDFGDRKSMPLTFGTVSFRVSTAIRLIANAKRVVELLREHGLKKCIRIKEEPDKDQMAELDDATLRAVGARRKTEDAFGYEVNYEKLQEEAA